MEEAEAVLRGPETKRARSPTWHQSEGDPEDLDNWRRSKRYVAEVRLLTTDRHLAVAVCKNI
jgi:hypothetical protein